MNLVKEALRYSCDYAKLLVLSKEKNKERMIETIIDRMFEYANIDMTYERILDEQFDHSHEEPWYSHYQMTEAQNTRWKKWLKWYISKIYSYYTPKIIEREVAMIDLMWGLRIKDWKKFEDK